MSNPLREARKLRGWTVVQLQAYLRAEAARRQLVLPEPTSLRVMISKWENGHRAPDEMYQSLLAATYGLAPEALGFVSDDEAAADVGASPWLKRRAGARALQTPAFIGYFTQQLAQHAQADNLMGPALIVGTVQSQASQLEQLVHQSSGAEPPESIALVARYEEVAGWLLQDSGQGAKALEFTNKAVDFAKVSGEAAVTAYCLMRKSAILHGLGRMQASLAIAKEAIDLAQREAPELLPVCFRQQALAAAGCRRNSDAELAVDMALAASDDLPGSDLDAYCTTAYVEMEAARCWLALNDPAKAAEAGRSALGHWSPDLIRDQGLCAAHLALALTMTSEVEEACHATTQAVSLIETAPSARAIQTLKQAAMRLAPFRQVRPVRSALDEVARVA